MNSLAAIELASTGQGLDMGASTNPDVAKPGSGIKEEDRGESWLFGQESFGQPVVYEIIDREQSPGRGSGIGERIEILIEESVEEILSWIITGSLIQEENSLTLSLKNLSRDERCFPCNKTDRRDSPAKLIDFVEIDLRRLICTLEFCGGHITCIHN